MISKSIATCLINKGPQIPASLQTAYFYSSLTFLRGTQKMALLGSPCPSQVKGSMSRLKGSLSKVLFIHLNKHQIFYMNKKNK